MYMYVRMYIYYPLNIVVIHVLYVYIVIAYSNFLMNCTCVFAVIQSEFSSNSCLFTYMYVHVHVCTVCGLEECFSEVALTLLARAANN